MAATGSAADVNAKIDSVLSDHEGFAKAFKILQANIDDGTEMAKEYEYPLTVVVDGKEVAFATQEDFVAGYDAMITPAIVAVVKKQQYKNLKVTSNGVIFGSGHRANAIGNDGSVRSVFQKSWTRQLLQMG